MTQVLQSAILMVAGWCVIGVFGERIEAIDRGVGT